MARQLTPRQLRFIAEYQKGVSGTDAAIAAGYSKRTARHAAYQLLHDNSQVRAELEKVRQNLAELTEYNAERCAAECDRGMEFALRTDNANAYVRAVELKGRLHGLLREKVDITVEHVDIRGALEAARERLSRPRRDPAPAIEGEFVALSSSEQGRSIDNESIEPRPDPYVTRLFGD